MGDRVTLSTNQAEEWANWWGEHKRTAAWADRYGGNFERVEQLIADSVSALEDERRRQHLTARRTRIFAAVMAVIAVTNLIFAGLSYSLWQRSASLLSEVSIALHDRIVSDRANAQLRAQQARMREVQSRLQAAYAATQLQRAVREQALRKQAEAQRARAETAAAEAKAAALQASLARSSDRKNLRVAAAENLSNVAWDQNSEINTDTGMLLAVEAYEENDDWETRSALFALVQQTPRLLRSFRAMQAPALSAGGDLLAMSSDQPPLYKTLLWDTHRNAYVHTWSVSAAPSEHETVIAQCFANDDRVLATLTLGGTARFYDVRTHALLKTFPKLLPFGGRLVYDRNLGCARTTPKVVFARDGTLAVVDASTFTVDFVRKVDVAEVVDLALTPDASEILASGSNGNLTVWNAKGEAVATCSGADVDPPSDSSTPPPGGAQPHGRPQDLALSPDGRMAAVYSANDRAVKIYSLPGCQLQRKLTAPVQVAHVAFLSDDDVMDVDRNSWIRHWNPHTGALIAGTSTAVSGFLAASNYEAGTMDRSATLYAGAQYGDGVFVYTLRNEGTAPLALFREGTSLQNRTYAANAAFAPDGATVLEPAGDHLVNVWNVAGGTSMPGLHDRSERFADGVLIARGGTKAYVYVVGDGKTQDWLDVFAYDLHRGALSGGRRMPIRSVRSKVQEGNIKLSRDGRELMVLSDEGLTRYLLANGRIRVTPPTAFDWNARGDDTVDRRLSPFGSYVVVYRQTSVNAAGVTIYDAAGRRVSRLPDYPARRVAGTQIVGFGSNGQTVLVRDENSVDVFDLATGKKRSGRIHLDKTVRDMVGGIGPNEKFIAVETQDGVQLYDPKSFGKVGRPLGGPWDGVRQIFFSPDERYVGALDAHSQLFVWDLDIKAIEKRACEAANRSLSRDEWTAFAVPFKYRTVCARYGIR